MLQTMLILMKKNQKMNTKYILTSPKKMKFVAHPQLHRPLVSLTWDFLVCWKHIFENNYVWLVSSGYCEVNCSYDNISKLKYSLCWYNHYHHRWYLLMVYSGPGTVIGTSHSVSYLVLIIAIVAWYNYIYFTYTLEEKTVVQGGYITCTKS